MCSTAEAAGLKHCVTDSLYGAGSSSPQARHATTQLNLNHSQLTSTN